MTIIRSMVWILSIACSNRIPAPNASCSPNSDPWKSSTWATPMILENNQNKSDSNWKLQYLYTMLMWQLCLIYSKPSKNIYHSLKEEIMTYVKSATNLRVQRVKRSSGRYKFDFRLVDGFLQALLFPPSIKLTRVNVTELLLKLALKTPNHNRALKWICIWMYWGNHS